MNPQHQVLGIWAAAKSAAETQLVDRDGEPIEPYGCNCDVDRPCSVAECLMHQDFMARHMGAWVRGCIVAGADPTKPL